VTATRRRVDLRERLEQPLAQVLGHADAGVLDGEAQLHCSGSGLAQPLDPHQHRPGVGELHGVAGEVREHLPQAPGIAAHDQRHVRADPGADVEPLFRRARRKQQHDLFDQLAHVDVLLVERQLAGFDLREVEDVGDDREQRAARFVERLDELALRAHERRAEQQLGHAEDAVERRANLVTDVGEELVLGERGLFGGEARLLHLAVLPQRQSDERGQRQHRQREQEVAVAHRHQITEQHHLVGGLHAPLLPDPGHRPIEGERHDLALEGVGFAFERRLRANGVGEVQLAIPAKVERDVATGRHTVANQREDARLAHAGVGAAGADGFGHRRVIEERQDARLRERALEEGRPERQIDQRDAHVAARDRRAIDGVTAAGEEPEVVLPPRRAEREGPAARIGDREHRVEIDGSARKRLVRAPLGVDPFDRRLPAARRFREHRHGKAVRRAVRSDDEIGRKGPIADAQGARRSAMPDE
jgi:hypothetical protein